MSGVSKAQKEAVYRYVQKSYDRVVLTLAKGERDNLKAAAAAAGESVNGYIKRAIEERMQREGKG